MTGKLRAAIVVQRYGEDVNGGSETLARRIAELLVEDIDVTVLTTCALDYLTWADAYPPGPANLNGVPVLRFSVPQPREAKVFEQASIAAYANPDDERLGGAWVQAEGPIAPDLIEHLTTERERYDAIAFVTYLYATTVEGLPRVAERALLVPTVHDEPPLRLRIFDRVFELPRLLLFSTLEEQELARARFGIQDGRSRLVGMGADEPPPSEAARFAMTTGIERPYALCLGRLDESKGVLELIKAHRHYRIKAPEGLDLVLIGRGDLDIPKHDWLHRLGFVPEQLKHDALRGAAVVILPSPYESLSLSQLEAWSHGRPTLANSASPVLEGQSRRSAGGLWYGDSHEYAAMLDFLVRAKPAAEAIGRQGRRFVRSSYSWDRVKERWLEALAFVADR
jgi:glycosyltransferase involved in cell wall biosynthesis